MNVTRPCCPINAVVDSPVDVVRGNYQSPVTVSPETHPFLFEYVNADTGNEHKTTSDNRAPARKKHVGVWGYGVVGRSLVEFFLSRGFLVAVMDRRTLPTEITLAGVRGFAETEEGVFFEWSEIVLPSPGVKIGAYAHNPHYAAKLYTELDLFAHCITQKTISITGSVGKTTVTHVLSELLIRYAENIATGGNIGYALMNLATEKADAHRYVLELSSAQLAHAQQFATDLAIITNIYPNHLDWHGSFDAYQHAKLHLVMLQHEGQHALLPLKLMDTVRSLNPRSTLVWFSTSEPSATELSALGEGESLYYIRHDNCIMRHDNTGTVFLQNITLLPPITFAENWLIMSAALNLLGHNLAALSQCSLNITIPSHRVEMLPKNRKNITVYNDSKSSTIASTLAALGMMVPDRPVRLILGGLGKGVDRAPLIAQIPKTVIHTYCFGTERDALAAHCSTYGKTHTVAETLNEIVTQCIQDSNPGDQILFSPAGTSFDYFANYQERGDAFKKLVHALLPE